jgi:hypothetical protein
MAREKDLIDLVIVEFPDRSYQYCVILYFSQRFYDALMQENLINP